MSSTTFPARVEALRRRKSLVVGVVIIGVLVVLGAIGPFLLADPSERVADPFLSPSASHWFGTDSYGRDVFSRCVNAIWLDLAIGVSVAVLAMVIGSAIGVVAGYLGGIVDDVIMRAVDILMAFPGFVLAMILLVSLGESLPKLAIALAIAQVAPFVRLVRSKVLSERELDYVAAARVSGARWPRVAFRHLLPNSIRPAAVQLTLVCGYSILNVAGLAYLGVGIHPPTAEWGVMVAEGAANMLTGQWWTAFFPGLMIAVTVMALHFIGDDLGGDRQ
ncbi:ABC transporter permease subunit [Nocardioides sp. LMS-CY]|uniref:Peptide/nickel transport system permease protein n=1 Tax=Nocardioides soli TaxID=1036020 RepID=A0A7W4Z128_9ACTN|nr:MULTISPECIES: ABC transporter permease [Nocardioides]MBB3041105.1 peptide/nickel transport system permease protein [Nocardioides soli]QWF23577.1 ABC transporter permease subunit [Nocardioides sp. LMS-CY]